MFWRWSRTRTNSRRTRRRCSRPCWQAAPGYRAARHDYVLALIALHRHKQAREQIEILIAAEPDNLVHRTTLASILWAKVRPRQPLHLYGELLRQQPDDPGAAPVARPRAQDTGTSRRGRARLSRGRAAASQLWRRVLEPCQPQDLSLHRRTTRHDARAGRRPAHAVRRPLSPLLRTRQGARGPWRVRRVVPVLRSWAMRSRRRSATTSRSCSSERSTSRSSSARASSSSSGKATAATTPRPSSSSACPAPARRCWSRSSPRTRRSKAPWNWPTYRGWSARSTCMRAAPATRTCWRCPRPTITAASARPTSATRDTTGSSNRPFFIDKMPNNFRHVGLIHLMLPNAKIIDARREPMACCFSNFKQLFASGQQFTYSLEDIGRYYRTVRATDGSLELGSAGSRPARAARGRHRGPRRQRAAHPRLLRAAISNPPASSSTRTSGACTPQVPSRSVGPSIARAWTSGSNFEPWLGELREALGPLAAP